MNDVEKMRESRKSPQVAFMKFVSNYKAYPDVVFCFYEGEDGKYYNQKIKMINGDEIYPIITGNKENVIKVYQKISDDESYRNTNKMFFVDRDFDDMSLFNDSDLFITDGYSVENYYVNLYTLKNVLESEFSMNFNDEDYIFCLNLFEKYYKKYNEIMLDFNALIKLRKVKGKNIQLKDYKLKDFVSISDKDVRKSNNFSKSITKLKLAIGVSEAEFLQAKNELNEYINDGLYFRGKNQLDFFCKFLKLLKEINDNDGFKIKRSAVYIDTNKNRLSQLSQYAYISNSLTDFIIRHKVQ